MSLARQAEAGETMQRFKGAKRVELQDGGCLSRSQKA